MAGSEKYCNSGLAESFNSLLLANIIRSAKGYPTYYSAVGDYSASTSSASSPTLALDLPLGDPNFSDLSAGLAPSFNRERNANISSLETKDFTLGMHKPISADLFIFVVNAHGGAYFNLTFTLVTETIVITREELDRINADALAICALRYDALPSIRRGIRDSFDAT